MKKIKHRLEMLIVLSLFFPVTLQALYKDATELAGITLKWGVPIAVLIACFILLEFITRLPDRLEKIAEFTAILTIAAYIIVLCGFALFPDTIDSYIGFIMLSIGVHSIMWGPVFLFGILIIGGSILEFRKQVS